MRDRAAEMVFRLVKGLIIVFAGPLVTLLLFTALQIPADKIDYSHIRWAIIGLASFTLLISALGHIFVKKFQNGLILTVTASEIVYLFTFAFYALSDPLNWQENLMWLPIMMLSVIALSLPMAFSISYGCGKIIREIRNREGIRRS